MNQQAKLIKFFLTVSVLIIGLGCVSVKSAPPRVCEIRESVWCVYYGPVEIINQLSKTAEYRSVWTVRGDLQPDKPFILLEPRGCRVGLSDVIELVSFDKQFKWTDKYWNRAVVRLKSDKSCDIELLTPSEYDEIQEAFSNSLGLIQACNTSTCEGPVLGEKILNLRDRLDVKKPSGGVVK